MFEAVVSRLIVLLPFIIVVSFIILKLADIVENTLNETLSNKGDKDEKESI